MDDQARSAAEEVVAAAITLVATTSPRAIQRRDQVGDRIVVRRSALLKLREAIEVAHPGCEGAVRRELTKLGIISGR
ncbi:hypothetical protein ACIBTV_27115 [Micromonospora sp. NPDC049366]|uniref:hypothetical protein n=1 Tax=Micromonospora sp. NPDC049366 TaxID=3364271 RepID=UPI0037AD21A0